VKLLTAGLLVGGGLLAMGMLGGGHGAAGGIVGPTPGGLSSERLALDAGGAYALGKGGSKCISSGIKSCFGGGGGGGGGGGDSKGSKEDDPVATTTPDTTPPPAPMPAPPTPPDPVDPPPPDPGPAQPTPGEVGPKVNALGVTELMNGGGALRGPNDIGPFRPEPSTDLLLPQPGLQPGLR